MGGPARQFGPHRSSRRGDRVSVFDDREFWVGVVTVPALVLAGALLAGVVTLLLCAWREWGAPLLRLLPTQLRTVEVRAAHASVIANADISIRLFWIAGCAVYVVQHGKTVERRKLLRTRAAIASAFASDADA